MNRSAQGESEVSGDYEKTTNFLDTSFADNITTTQSIKRMDLRAGSKGRSENRYA